MLFFFLFTVLLSSALEDSFFCLFFCFGFHSIHRAAYFCTIFIQHHTVIRFGSITIMCMLQGRWEDSLFVAAGCWPLTSFVGVEWKLCDCWSFCAFCLYGVNGSRFGDSDFIAARFATDFGHRQQNVWQNATIYWNRKLEEDYRRSLMACLVVRWTYELRGLSSAFRGAKSGSETVEESNWKWLTSEFRNLNSPSSDDWLSRATKSISKLKDLYEWHRQSTNSTRFRWGSQAWEVETKEKVKSMFHRTLMYPHVNNPSVKKIIVCFRIILETPRGELFMICWKNQSAVEIELGLKVRW